MAEALAEAKIKLEEAKNSRATIARTLTRRINELKYMVKSNGVSIDIEEKIEQTKKSFDDLGWAQDEVMDAIDVLNNKELLETETTWYSGYMKEANGSIVVARDYLESLRRSKERDKPDKSVIKIERLKIPVFNSQPRTYLGGRYMIPVR